MQESKDFRILARELHLAGRLGYSGDDMFYKAALEVGPSTTAAAVNFLNGLIASDTPDSEIWDIWFRTQTYIPPHGQTRPFTTRIISLLENPREPGLPTDL